ncbi:MAG TPA: MFS transporter [Candidatus Angelobacter sp.]|jgi:ABC-type branched-subunit amino acid transport system ATPase component/predicted MFS family arabinose efflux permease|nr:MFS transporter [Candidatus Angelobacter sp.]
MTAQRTLVPSQRQQDEGATSGGPSALRDSAIVADPVQEKRGRGDALRAYLRAYNIFRELSPVQTLALLSLSLTDLAENVATQAVPFLIIGSQREFGFSPAMVVTLLSSVGVLAAFTSPVIGYYGDRVRRMPLMIGGAVVQGAFCLLAGRGGLPLLVLGVSMMNLGGGLAGPLSAIRYSVVADYIPPHLRARAYTVETTGGNLGKLIGPAFGGLMAASIGWRTGFLVCGAILVVTVFAYLPLREPSRGQSERIAAGLADNGVAPPPPPLGEALRAIWAVRTLRRIYLALPVVSLGGGVLYGLNFVKLQRDFRFDVSALGMLATVAMLTGMVANIGMAPLVDRFTTRNPARNMLLIGSLMVASGFVMVGMTLAPWVVLAVPLSILMQALGGLMGPAQSTLPSLVVPPRVRAFGLSMVAVWGLPATLIAGPLILLIGNQYGTVAGMVTVLPLYLIGALMYWSGQPLIAHDIRAAQAAAIAEQETRRQRDGRRTILVCRDVDVTYSGVQVLFGVDFDVAEGEIVALLGTNGAGKSTLLRAISGLSEASNGAIFFDGRDITHLPTQSIARAGVVMVLGGRAIFPNLTVRENLDAATWTTASDAGFVRTQMHRVLDEFFPALRRRLQERAGTLSGGEQQMLALGQAFLMKPRLLMIDELSLGLAPSVVEQLLTILRAIHAQGTTIILVEQSVNLALTIAERAVYMEKGEVRFAGPTAELLERPDVMRSVFLAGAARATTLTTGSSARRATAGHDDTRPVVLEAHGLRCRFGGVEALRGVDLSVRAAEIVGIIGPNGAGKTTLFDALSGFVPLVAGTVRLGAQEVTDLDPDARARLGLTRSFQDARLFGALTVRETIMVAMERHGVVRSAALAALWLPPVRASEARLRRRADMLVELLGLQRYAEWSIGELSTGTRRVVDIACTMAAEPEVLLLDEPSSGVAQAEVQELAPLLQRLRAETGCALLVIEHDITLISTVSDRLVAMELGETVAEGKPTDVLADPRVVASYLGTSKEAIARTGAVPV